MNALKGQTKQHVLVETTLILGLMVIPVIFWPQTLSLTMLIPLGYLILERITKKRSWGEIGFKVKTFKQDIKANWFLILLVGIIIQVLVLGGASLILPKFLAHVQSRVEGVLGVYAIAMFAMLPISTLIEELIYRAFFLERFSRYFNPHLVNVAISVIFAVMHWSTGELPIVLIDVALIVVDSTIYGLIYLRGRNILVAWLAHLLVDIVGLAGLLWLV